MCVVWWEQRESVHGSRSKKERKKKITDSRELRKETSPEVFLSAVQRGAQCLDVEGFLDVEAKDVVVLFQDFKGEAGCCIWMCVGVVFSKSGGPLSVCRSCHAFS